MTVRSRLYGAVGFGYLAIVGLLAIALVVVGCVAAVLGRSAGWTGDRYDAAVVGVLVWVLQPIDRIPAGSGEGQTAGRR